MLSYSADTLIATETDKSGRNIEIYHANDLILSEVYPFFLVQAANLMDSGFAWKTKFWDEAVSSAIYAKHNNQIIGHIVYQHLEKERSLWIVLSSVDPEQRGKGIYSILHNYYEARARELHCLSLSSSIHKNNKVRLKSAAAVGLHPAFHMMIKKLV